MAGGPHAAVICCLDCFGPADRIQEGTESDLYACRDCGQRFGIDWRRGPAEKPCWPPSPEELEWIQELRAQRQSAAAKRPREDTPPG